MAIFILSGCLNGSRVAAVTCTDMCISMDSAMKGKESVCKPGAH